jgi:hypothetical protein
MRDESLRTQISLASITVLLIGCLMFAFMIIESALADNNFRALRRDPGLGALRVLVYFIPFYAFVPLYVYLVGDLRLRVLRWVVVAIAGLGFVFWILHHLSHWYFGGRPTFSSHVIDLCLHTLGLWLLISSIKWARLPFAAREIDRAPIASKVALGRE